MTLQHDTEATDALLNRSWRVMGDSNYPLGGCEENRRIYFEHYFDVQIRVSTEIIGGRFGVCAN